MWNRVNIVLAQETGSILKIVCALSKWPHLPRAYLVTECKHMSVAVCPRLACPGKPYLGMKCVPTVAWRSFRSLASLSRWSVTFSRVKRYAPSERNLGGIQKLRNETVKQNWLLPSFMLSSYFFMKFWLESKPFKGLLSPLKSTLFFNEVLLVN